MNIYSERCTMAVGAKGASEIKRKHWLVFRWDTAPDSHMLSYRRFGSLGEVTVRDAPGRVAAENGAGSVEQPLITGRSNVRHIKGVLPVVYKPRYMDISTRKADEIMFATGNANKLKEASTLRLGALQ